MGEMTKTITVKPDNNNNNSAVTIEQTIALPESHGTVATPDKSITEILGVKVDTGLSWYWEGAIIILALAVIYMGKKAIDNKLFKQRED